MSVLATTTRSLPSRPSANLAWACALLLAGCGGDTSGGEADLIVDEVGGQQSRGPLALEFDGQDPDALLLARGVGPLFTSKDHGDTWTRLGRRTGKGSREPIESFADNAAVGGNLCVVTSKGTWSCSQDGAQTWRQALKPKGPKFGSHLFAGGADKPHRLYGAFVMPPPYEGAEGDAMPQPVGTVGWSDDLGQTWQLSHDLEPRNLYMLLAPPGPVLVRFGKAGVSVDECDPDLNCTMTYQSRPNEATIALVNPFDPRQKTVRLHEGNNSVVFSRDGDTKMSGSFVCGKQCAYMDAHGPWGTLVSARDDGFLWISQDGGDTWAKVAPLPSQACDLISNGRGAQFCVGQTSLHRSLDDGATWDAIELPQLGGR